MKKTAVIYNRRSQDRDDRQQNSLETQLNNSFDTLDRYDLELVGEPIIESVSAKTEFKRAGFERMIDLCKKGGIDYIIVDEPKRLSRNNIDSSRIVDLMDKKQIEGVLTTSREYLTEHPRDKFFLQFDLSLSKMDNEERGIDVKKKMLTALHNGQWLGKAIFGYKNVGPKGKKDVEVIEEEAKLVREGFIMRSQGISLKGIADFISEKTGAKWNSERVSKMLKNTKYYGLQKFAGEEDYLTSPGYRPTVSKELFDKVNGIKKSKEYNKRDDLVKYFDGILFDPDGVKLSGYKQKQYIYYHNTPQSKYKLNVSENWLFSEIEKYIDRYNFPEPFINLTKLTLREYYKDKVSNRTIELRKAKKELNEVETKLEALLDMRLLNDITKDEYENKKTNLEKRKLELEEKYNALKQGEDNIVKVIEDLCELVENLGNSYKTGNKQIKGKIIRALQCELILNDKKELTIKESKLFEMISSLNNQFWYSHGELNSGLSLEKAAS